MNERRSERIEFLKVDNGVLPLHDLSATGVSCVHKSSKVPNSIVRCTLGDMTLSAKVIYCKPQIDAFKIGLQFVKVTNQEQEAIDGLVEEFSKGVLIRCSVID